VAAILKASKSDNPRALEGDFWDPQPG